MTRDAGDTVASRSRGRVETLSLALAALLPALLVLAAVNRSVTSDPTGALLVSEQLVRSGTVFLDAYSPEVIAQHWTIVRVDDHWTYFFALGSSVASAPVVALLVFAGVDIAAHEGVIQIGLAALLASLTVILMYRLARFFLPHFTSLLLALAFWLGTSLASSGGTALWSHHFAVVFALVALISLLAATEGDCRWCWLPLGISLFMAYLSRPTMAGFAVFVLGYAFMRARRTAVRAIVILTTLLAVFVLWSQSMFGTMLPAYYQPGRLTSSDPLAGLVGILVSPSRGLLVFSPFLLALVALAFINPDRLRSRRGLLVIALGWPVALLVIVAGFPDWYGGWSYGPRLMTDALPGLFLALVLVWPTSFHTAYARVVLVASCILMLFSIYVHSVQGLFNPYAATWNALPEVNANPETLWDWRYPQFLHNEERHAQRLLDYGDAIAPQG